MLRVLAPAIVLLVAWGLWAADPPTPAAPATQPAQGDSVPLEIKMPRPRFICTPRNMRHPERYEMPDWKAVPPLVPQGTVNLARHRPVTSSDEATLGDLKWVTDDNRSGQIGDVVELFNGCQWVQIDLGRSCPIYWIAVWHFQDLRAYHDVVVRVSNDPNFKHNVTTLFNNDADNSSGLGKGTDREYIESWIPKLINAKGISARYVRLYSRGNTDDDYNHYAEVDVYGLPGERGAVPATRPSTRPADLVPLTMPRLYPVYN